MSLQEFQEAIEMSFNTKAREDLWNATNPALRDEAVRFQCWDVYESLSPELPEPVKQWLMSLFAHVRTLKELVVFMDTQEERCWLPWMLVTSKADTSDAFHGSLQKEDIVSMLSELKQNQFFCAAIENWAFVLNALGDKFEKVPEFFEGTMERVQLFCEEWQVHIEYFPDEFIVLQRAILHFIGAASVYVF
jgi:hypothetical protein